MSRLVGILAFVAGCDFTFNLDHLKAPPVDSGPDAESLYMDAPGCFGKYGAGNAGLAQICLDAAPLPDWTPNGELHTGGALNTECSFTLPQSGTQTELCVIVAQNITIGGYVPTSGERPVVFVATDTFTLLATGKIGVDSRRGAGRLGAGFNEISCPTTPSGTPSATGSGGGAGGSFGTKSGNGGNGTGSGIGGTALGAVSGLATVRGGCKGGIGGGFTPAGASGGAVYIIAGKGVVIEGTIDASGQGGVGGTKATVGGTGGNGGGGGGSGGLIAIDSPSIRIASTAILVANGGGGGGGGAGPSSGSDGQNGQEADLSMPPTFPALGGSGGSASGDGGRGADRSTNATNGAPGGVNVAASGGGGGGGGAGIIRFYSPAIDNQATKISPPAT